MIAFKRFQRVIVRYCIALFALLFSCMPVLTYSQSYHFMDFNIEQGLAQPYVYSLTQDNKGYLWIGTGDGLSRYDGYAFKTYTTKDSLADNFVTCSFKEEKGIWFGHMSGDLSFYSDGLFTKRIIVNEDKTMITDIENGPDNTIWASSYSNGFIVMNRKLEIDTVSLDTNQLFPVISFKFLSENVLLIGSINGLAIYDYHKTGRITYKKKFLEIPETKITDIIEIKENQEYLVASQDEGIYYLTKDNSEFEVIRVDTNSVDPITGIQNLLFDTDSNIWAGTFGGGLHKFKLSSEGRYSEIFNFNKDQGFSSDYIKVVFEDREGIIWSGNYGTGLSRIVKKSYSYSFFDENTESKSILSISIDDQYRWLGTDKGLLKLDHQTGIPIKLYDQQYNFPNDKITAILQVRNVLWIGTSKSGLYKFDPVSESIEYFPIHTGDLENSITSITGNKDQIWIGTRKGLCSISPFSNNIQWYTIRQGGLPNNSINQVLLDSKGKLWIATHGNTLSILDNGVINKMSIPAENGIFTLNAITEDKNGNIWLGTLGNGIFLLDEDTLIHFTTHEGLFSDYCYSMISDAGENLWVGHKGGISRVNTREFYVKSIQHSFEITKSYEFNTNASAMDKNETVWLGFNKGLLAINNFDEISTSVPPRLNITSILINDNEAKIKDKINLSPGRYKISIEFIAICLKEPDLTKYQYMLEGYDDIPVITQSKRVVYPRLSAGHYTFHASAINGDGIITDSPIHLNFYIQTPIWKKVWFYGMLIVLIFGITVWSIQRQKKKIQLENIKLETKVKERTIELSTQKEEIKKQHDLINTKNQDIMDSIVYASRIQEAIIPPIELLYTLLPNSFMINLPRNVVSGDFYWIAEKNNSIIFAVADCSGHGVPGAFMSILGNTLLNDIVHEKKISSPEKILNQLRTEIIQSLRQNNESFSTMDSINMAICALDKRNMKLQYAGAYHPLIHIRGEEMKIIASDRFTLGISHKQEASFTLHDIELEKGDTFYMCSDGIQDQFGGPRDKKYSTKRLYRELLKQAHQPMAVQQKKLEKIFKEWKGENEQIDDMILMGVQI